MYKRDTEIRKLSSNYLYELAQTLDSNDSWRKLIRVIPKDPFSDSPQERENKKYNFNHEQLIENASKNQNRMPAEILFEEWSTSGRKRPTLGVLLELLTKAQLYRAADLVAVKYLSEAPPTRPSQGPAARIDISIPLDSEFVNGLEDMLENGDSLGTETLNDNANPSRMADNNIDYYEKYTPNVKRLSISLATNRMNEINPPNNNETEAPIQQTDLMKFSSAHVTAPQSDIPLLTELNQTSALSESNNSSGTVTAEKDLSTSLDLPVLSALYQHSSTSKNISNDGSPTNNKSETKAAMQHSDSMNFPLTSFSSSHDVIPMLSEFHQSTSPTTTMDLPNLSTFNTQSSMEDIIPNLSTLHVHDVSPQDNPDKPNSKLLQDMSPSKQSVFSGDSTISSSTDDEDISVPNLSILDQRSSNNDSSLTNVTANSEENSFEISLNERSTSFENIPCLSALK